MQKIFIRYFLVIMVVTVAVTLCANTLFQIRFAQQAATERGKSLIYVIGDKIANNNRAIERLTQSLSENYIARACAFAEIIDQNPAMLDSFEEMERMTRVLQVDEVHVTDGQGILRWGNIKSYYGLDFSKTDQTRPFMAVLADKKVQIAQPPQPNGSEGKLFQYIGVARQDKPGIVQVGVRPQVLDSALANNRIDVVIADFNVPEGESVLAIDKKTGLIVADSHRAFVGKSAAKLGIPQDCIDLKRNREWVELDGAPCYMVFGDYGDYVIAASYTKANLYAAQMDQNIVASISGVVLGLAILLAIFILLKRLIINDMETVNRKVGAITRGNLNVVVDARACPEFVTLSDGINGMVASLKRQIHEIESQAAELEESHKNILSSLSYARRIQNNLLPDPNLFRTAFRDFAVLWEPKDVVGGDIYWIRNFEQGTVLCVCDCTGHGTPGALLTMLVATALETIVTRKNCRRPPEILWELDQKLFSTLNAAESETGIRDGADMAVLFIAKDGEITMASANISLFVCNGQTVETLKGQKISIGEGQLGELGKVTARTILADPHNKYYVASDGLFDQVGGARGIPFGYRNFKKVILDNHNLPQDDIVQLVWAEFTTYMGNEIRRDDITLMSFTL